MAAAPPDGFSDDQMRQMQAMLSAAGGMGGMMPPPSSHNVGFPGTSPAIDPTMAYMQMLQNFQQQAGGMGGGMGMLPGGPFPGMAPYLPPAPQEPTVSVSVEGMRFQYQLTEDDIQKVFRRYGHVKNVLVDDKCSSARVTFQDHHDAQAAINDLDGKVLNGLNGTLRISWVSQPAPPYGGGLPSLGFPGQAAPLWHAAPTSSGGDMDNEFGMGDKAHVKSARKYTCRFLIGIDNDKDFQVARKLIGSKGCNMKRIVKMTGAKLRLRGVGSGYLEGAAQKESSEPLQLCVSCTSPDGYQTAVRQVEDLLKAIYDEYRQYCQDHDQECPELSIKISENQLLYSSRGGYGTAGVGAQPADGAGTPKKDRGPKKQAVAKRGARAAAEGDRGEPGPNAPTVDEIQDLINQRNEARRQSNFAEADRIRELLYSRGVALMDEPGGRGKGAEVTTWRYWRE